MCLKHTTHNGPLAYHWLPSSSRAGIEGRAPQIIYFNFHDISYRIFQCINSKIGYLRVTFTFRLKECTREKNRNILEDNVRGCGTQLVLGWRSELKNYVFEFFLIIWTIRQIFMGCAMFLLQSFNQIQYPPGSGSRNRDLHIRSRSLSAVQVQSGNFSSFSWTLDNWNSCFTSLRLCFWKSEDHFRPPAVLRSISDIEERRRKTKIDRRWFEAKNICRCQTQFCTMIPLVICTKNSLYGFFQGGTHKSIFQFWQ